MDFYKNLAVQFDIPIHYTEHVTIDLEYEDYEEINLHRFSHVTSGQSFFIAALLHCEKGLSGREKFKTIRLNIIKNEDLKYGNLVFFKSAETLHITEKNRMLQKNCRGNLCMTPMS